MVQNKQHIINKIYGILKPLGVSDNHTTELFQTHGIDKVDRAIQHFLENKFEITFKKLDSYIGILADTTLN